MNRITGIKIDKRVADNFTQRIPTEMLDSQLIKITVSVVDQDDVAQTGVLVHWSCNENPDLLRFYDEDKNYIPVLSGMLTNGNGEAVMYVGSYDKVIFNIGAHLGDVSQKPDNLSLEPQQTLVICSFSDQLVEDELEALSIPLNGLHGGVDIPFQGYSTTASRADPLSGGGKMAIWMYGTIGGFADDTPAAALLDVRSYEDGDSLNIDVPYQWMINDNTSSNQLAYLLYQGGGTQSRILTFSAEGTAEAMPNPNRGGVLDMMLYKYAISHDILTDQDLEIHSDALDFVIPQYSNYSDTDKILINFYMNGWDDTGVNPSRRRFSFARALIDLKQPDGTYIFSLPGSLVRGCQANDESNGIMYFCYQVNDDQYRTSKNNAYHINFK